ncbi:hypothetical protein ABZ154_26415 [Streptomyces sp. NPDC006261]
MSEQTPSQAEGDRGPDTEPSASDHPAVARTTPSQAEGDRAEGDETEAAD